MTVGYVVNSQAQRAWRVGVYTLLVMWWIKVLRNRWTIVRKCEEYDVCGDYLSGDDFPVQIDVELLRPSFVHRPILRCSSLLSIQNDRKFCALSIPKEILMQTDNRMQLQLTSISQTENINASLHFVSRRFYSEL